MQNMLKKSGFVKKEIRGKREALLSPGRTVKLKFEKRKRYNHLTTGIPKNIKTNT